MGLDGFFFKTSWDVSVAWTNSPFVIGPNSEPIFSSHFSSTSFLCYWARFEPNSFSLGLVLRRFSFSREVFGKNS
jgi:hypothetical protein